MGIGPVDERLGGLEKGGSYLVVGPPGPAKMVTALQFLHEGLRSGEATVLLTGADARGLLYAARGWGFDLDEHWRSGALQILGFRDDFELRAARTIAPEEVLEELQGQIPGGVERLAVDPGTLFLGGGIKTLLGGAFLRWVRGQEATVCVTFSVDTETGRLPSSADWLVHGTTGRLVVVPTAGGLFEMSLIRSVPHEADEEAPVSLQLKPGAGMVRPEAFPSRRRRDREGLDRRRLLLVSLADAPARDLKMWAETTFEAAVVTDPFDAVNEIQAQTGHGSVVVHASRGQVRDAIRACRALRPLTQAALVFVSDDAIRSMDRVQLFEAGADDCLSGGVDFRELELRLTQAMSTNARPMVQDEDSAGEETDGGRTEGGRLDPAAFRSEVLRRASTSDLGVFSLLTVSATGIKSARLVEIMDAEIRDEDGDLLCDGAEPMVLLQGARAAQAEPFLDRLRARVGAESGRKKRELSVEVLSHPVDGEQIRSLLEADRAGKD
ncbi:MAG: hypothetical protein JSU98_02580 [Gemmatimonadales bacterium]|nr:MAG: hypothetical protein JSU98_02580 [Gemmatimonadales bacterium]